MPKQKTPDQIRHNGFKFNIARAYTALANNSPRCAASYIHAAKRFAANDAIKQLLIQAWTTAERGEVALAGRLLGQVVDETNAAMYPPTPA